MAVSWLWWVVMVKRGAGGLVRLVLVASRSVEYSYTHTHAAGLRLAVLMRAAEHVLLKCSVASEYDDCQVVYFSISYRSLIPNEFVWESRRGWRPRRVPAPSQ